MNRKTNSKFALTTKIGIGIVGLGLRLFGQAAPAKPEPDVLDLTDGEKLIGHFTGASGGSLTFHSDGAGDVTVDWSKVKSLKSSAKFAVPEKGVVLDKHADLSKVPQGTVTAEDQKIAVNPGTGAPPTVIPVANAANVVPQPSFLRAFQKPKFTDFWHGSASLGIALTESTQNSENISSALSLSRTVSNESWIDPRYRTTFDFASAYGELSQSGKPTVKTDLIHADLEHDIYFSRRVYGFVSAAFDHSISQGLKLQQTYGGGIGYAIFKSDNQEFDVKASIDYIRQSFEDVVTVLPDGTTSTVAPSSRSLIGAVIAQTYMRTFKHGIVFNEALSVTPAFNDSQAYSALGSANLSIPVYKKLAFTIGTVDAFFNEPPAGFKKNSFQFLTQISYSIR